MNHKFQLYRILILLLLSLSIGNRDCFPQKPYKFVRYSNKEGFNQNTVLAINRDKNGFLWLGTSHGLYSFDYYNFKNFTQELESLPYAYQSRIKNIYSDSKGLVWFIGQEGLYVYNPDNERFYYPFKDSVIRYNRILEDKGNLWLLGENYLSKVETNILKDTILFKLTSNLLEGNDQEIIVNDAIVLDNNMLLLGTNQGIYSFSTQQGNLSRIKFYPENTLENQSHIYRIIQVKDMIWIATGIGLYKTVLDDNRLHLIGEYRHNEKSSNSISDNTILDLFPDPNGNLWIGTGNGGLSHYNSKTNDFTNYTYSPKKADGISSSQVNCIYQDEFNVLWVGTAQGGLCKFDLNQKEFINLENNPYEISTLPGNLINRILEDSKGYLWVSTYMNPLSKSMSVITDSTLTELKFKRFDTWFNSYPDKNILSLFEDKEGYIWIGYQNSLVLYNPSLQTFSPIHFLQNDTIIPCTEIQRIVQLDDNKLLFAGSSLVIVQDPWKYLKRSGYEIPVLTKYTLKYIPDNRNKILSSLIDDQGRIWLGTRNNGLFIFEFKDNRIVLLRRFQYGSDQQIISNNAVFCMFEDKKKNVWIGTFGGGINKIPSDQILEKDSFQYIGVSQGLPDNAIYGIIEEDDSTLWISTDMGLCKFNINNYKTVSYNINNGISSNNFRLNAYYKGISGYFYFGGLNGITIFKPDNIRLNNIPPKIIIADLKIDNKKIKCGEYLNNRILLNKPITETSSIILTPKERAVAFDIIVQQSSSPQNNRIQYILEGFDKEWTKPDVGKYTATYTNLPTGKYFFKVKGFSGDGIISDNLIDLEVTVLAPWYKRWWSYSLFGLIILFFAYGISWYFIKYENLQHKLEYEQKDKERIQQTNQAKLRFFTNISHEFRTPLSLISAPIQLLERTNVTDEQKKFLSIIEKNTKRLINLIDQLLIFRKMDQDHIKLKLAKTSLGDFFYPIAEGFETLSLKRNINFYYNISDPDVEIIVDYEKMERVLFNLLSNAFKFTLENGTVQLEAKIEKIRNRDFIRFDVTDNGKGVPKSELEKIFERFYQVDSEFNDIGTGIGLSVSKSIVELHNGYFELESNPGKKTCFSVFVPLLKSDEFNLEQYEIKNPTIDNLIDLERLNYRKTITESKVNTHEYSVLILDDEDEFRELLKDVLQNLYNLSEAHNAKEALDKISDVEPDLIISDVMMPGMNGYAFCQKIKSSIDTCHIPVILLTALGDIEMQIKGVEFGADAYFTKPFYVDQLLVTVQKLIENRKKIKEHFSRSYDISADIHLSSFDQKLILAVNSVIDKNLDNSSFGVEELASEVNLSTSQFYRKLKLLTGQIPNAYIRNYRLQKAADMLIASPGIGIKNVMFAIGIESASYFSHAFKKRFGVLPSEFSNKSLENRLN